MFITPSLLLIAMAVLLAVIMIPAILNTKKWQKAMKKTASDEVSIRILSFFTLLVSFLFLSVHWKLTGGWFIIIPIIGWLALIKAVVYLWWPEFVYTMAKKTYLKSEGMTALIAFLGLVIAIGLTYVALYIY